MKTVKEIKNHINETTNLRFMRLLYTDLLGHLKNVEVPFSQFDKALKGEVAFDGSSIEGFTRIEESDMLLKPDLETFRVMYNPSMEEQSEAWLICDVYRPDGTPFEGCPRQVLKRQMQEAQDMGYGFLTGPEVEFFLFNEATSLETNDHGGYFDVAPVDKGDYCRRDIVLRLESLGFIVEAAHHEVAPGQHEINFQFDNALYSADAVMIFKMVVRQVAHEHGLHATFMPKPLFGENGSGMHTNQSLLRDGSNAFADKRTKNGLSETALHYIGGILAHAKNFVAITNPLINSYKRLVPGYEAPINVAWSCKNRSPLVRIPASRGRGTRVEVRVPDPSCNPYLAFAVMLASGLDGIKNKLKPGPATDRNIFAMSDEEKEALGIGALPESLEEALFYLESDDVIKECLGDHVFTHYMKIKDAEVREYSRVVHPWEVDRYLSTY